MRSLKFLLLAVLLVAAGAGTATAAGEIITRGDQVAPGVLDSRHLAARSVARSDLERPYLRARVDRTGKAIGAADAEVRRVAFGRYALELHEGALADPTGPRTALDASACAITVTPRETGAVLMPITGFSQRNRFDVLAYKPIVASGGFLTYTLTDAAFDAVVVC